MDFILFILNPEFPGLGARNPGDRYYLYSAIIINAIYNTIGKELGIC